MTHPSEPGHRADHHGDGTQPHTSAEWDTRYGESEHLWSGAPNGALLAQVTALPPGRALDVGCGEGADAIWLAQRGWRVTALDVSAVAVERGRAAAAMAGRPDGPSGSVTGGPAAAEIDWQVTPLSGLQVPEGGFGLVSAMYPALPRTEGAGPLLAAVAPGGLLLFVHHADVDRERALAHGCDPDQFLSVADVRAALGDAGWTIETDERRPRHVSSGAGAGHRDDEILQARRPA